MVKPQKPRSGRMNLASCVVATIFLAFVLILLLIVFFTVFKPRDPKIAVAAVQLPIYSAANGAANFTFAQYISVRNPNRAAFAHYDSSVQLLYSGNQVGFMFVPAGQVAAGRTEYMAATFSVKSFPLATAAPSVSLPPAEAVGRALALSPPPPSPPPFIGGYGGGGGGFRLGPAMQFESRMQMAGTVRILHFFTHHLEAKASCTVSIAVSDGSVLGFHC